MNEKKMRSPLEVIRSTKKRTDQFVAELSKEKLISHSKRYRYLLATIPKPLRKKAKHLAYAIITNIAKYYRLQKKSLPSCADNASIGTWQKIYGLDSNSLTPEESAVANKIKIILLKDPQAY